MKDELMLKLKQKIIDQLKLEDLTVDDIGNDEALIGEGLGLDSIDVLELIVMLDRQYGIKVKGKEQGQAILRSVRTIAEHILASKA